jgi:hypothetical protein
MDPVLADLLKSVLMEVTKVIGPAVVAALATYGVTRWQFLEKLREIERTQEFSARQNLFDYYKNRQLKLAEGYQQLSGAFGQLLGMATACEEQSTDKSNRLVESFAGIADIYVGIAPFDIDISCRDLAAKGLENTEEYAKLQEYRRIASAMSLTGTFGVVRGNILSLLEIYGFLERCNHLVLEKQMEALFSKYIKGT